MANAKQCDRCGRYFNPLTIERMMCKFYNPIYQSKTDVDENKVGSFLLQHESPDAMVDLCPKCAEDFELFMNNMPLAIYNDPPMCEKDFDHAKATKQLDKDFDEIIKRDLTNNWVTGYKYKGGNTIT